MLFSPIGNFFQSICSQFEAGRAWESLMDWFGYDDEIYDPRNSQSDSSEALCGSN